MNQNIFDKCSFMIEEKLLKLIVNINFWKI